MPPRIIPPLAAMLLSLHLCGQPRLNAIVETKRFMVPNKGERVDVHITIVGNTVVWTTDERGFQQAKVDALTMIEKDGDIQDFRKTLIQSPDRADTLQGDFLNQESFLLQPGAYSLSVELHDANSTDTARTYVHVPLVIGDRTQGISISDILFTLPGAPHEEPMPFPGSYFPPGSDKLGFYAEIYGTIGAFGPKGPFLEVTSIEDYETGKVVGNFRFPKRLVADTVVPVGTEFDIALLPTGNYLLTVEIHDRKDSLIERRAQFFQRNNPVTLDPNSLATGQLGANFTDAFADPDTLAEYLNSMRPIADELERKMIDDRWKDRKPALMRQLMYTFWYNRSPSDPKAAWDRYNAAVTYVNRKFGCRNMRGYQSDQGYIYLRYGAPNTVADRSNETTAVPYMIWHYYRAGRYADRRFVFYQPERSTTCWTLLTSDMPGELNNSKWLDMLAPGFADGGAKRDEIMDNYKNPR
ncbi:MAG: GWxTD domain-containing protein [Bacteroidetes bacterium]|nr:GWxTD domain-containing protein [Bacteroidota bacterium]MBS1943251.1 GWxTD domain-containing protein [Bacteroidota bacterium]